MPPILVLFWGIKPHLISLSDPASGSSRTALQIQRERRKKKARKRRQRLIPPFHGSQPVCLRMICKPPVLDPAHSGDGNYLPGRCSLSCALIFRHECLESSAQARHGNTKLQLSSFVFPLSRAEAAALPLPLPPPPAALGSAAGPRSHHLPQPEPPPRFLRPGAASGGGQVIFRLKTERMLGD